MSDNSLTLLKTLYYRLTESDTSLKRIQVTIDFIPYISTESTYSGLTNSFMMDENSVPNNDVISFTGYRTPAATNLGKYSIYSLYNETVTIQTANGYISAGSIYNDGGTGFAT
jgi:hypothetical protein